MASQTLENIDTSEVGRKKLETRFKIGIFVCSASMYISSDHWTTGIIRSCYKHNLELSGNEKIM